MIKNILLAGLFMSIGHARTYEYDSDGRLMRVAYPSGRGVVYDYDAAGNLTSVTPLSLPVAPTGLMASRNGSEVTLTWSDHADNESGYIVYRRRDGGFWSVLANLTANSQSYLDTTAESALSSYEYRVVANSANGPSSDSNITEAISNVPFEISEFELTEPTGETIELIITIPSDTGAVYVIEESDDLIRWKPVSIANHEELFTGAFNQRFLGDDGESTTVVIEIPGATEAKFYRPVQQ